MPIFDFANHPVHAVDVKGCYLCGHKCRSFTGRDYCDLTGKPLEQTKQTRFCTPCQKGNPYVPLKMREEQANGDTEPIC